MVGSHVRQIVTSYEGSELLGRKNPVSADKDRRDWFWTRGVPTKRGVGDDSNAE